MSTKIIAWSMRCSRARTCGAQLPVWYVALVPNRPASDRAKSAAATWADTPWLRAPARARPGSTPGRRPGGSDPASCGFGEEHLGLASASTSGYGLGKCGRARDNGAPPPAIPWSSSRADRADLVVEVGGQADRRRRVPAGPTGRQGRPGGPQRRREDHAPAGARRRRPAPGRARPPGRRHRLPLAGPPRATPCPTTPPSSPTCSPGAGSTSSWRALEKLRIAMEENPSSRNIERFGAAQEQFESAGGYAAEAEVRKLAAGVGLRDGPARPHPRRALRR